MKFQILNRWGQFFWPVSVPTLIIKKKSRNTVKFYNKGKKLEGVYYQDMDQPHSVSGFYKWIFKTNHQMKYDKEIESKDLMKLVTAVENNS